WQPTGHTGTEITGVAGTPVWHQLTTLDFAAVLAFYTDVFGWQVQTESDSDEFRYSTALFGGEQLLGVMDGTAFMAAGEPSNWFFFLGADDVDKTQQLIVDHGGAIVRAAEDTPYGRLASVTDPTGAGFNLSSL
ncbi:MAG: VOC family protein, partial [Mycobacterium sp.]